MTIRVEFQVSFKNKFRNVDLKFQTNAFARRRNLLTIHSFIFHLLLNRMLRKFRRVEDDVPTTVNVLWIIIIVVGRVLKGALLTNRRFGLEKTKTN